MSRICIIGAGAVGGFMGALLAKTGHNVSCVARGETLDALRRNGLQLHIENQQISTVVEATNNPQDLGIQDVVIIAVKAQSMTDIAPLIPPLTGPHTLILTAMNGVPWWFFNSFGGSCCGERLKSVDPTGIIADNIPAQNIIGGVVHGSFKIDAPGVVRHVGGRKLIIGEPAGGRSERVATLAQILTSAGLEIEISEAIQKDVWFKLWGNMTMNPISALTGATCDRILDDPLVSDFCIKVMEEAARIGERIGCPVGQSAVERNAVTRQLGAFKTSMLHDVEMSRSVELDAIVSAVREIGQNVKVATPNIDILLGLSRLHAQVRGLYPAPESALSRER